MRATTVVKLMLGDNEKPNSSDVHVPESSTSGPCHNTMTSHLNLPNAAESVLLCSEINFQEVLM